MATFARDIALRLDGMSAAAASQRLAAFAAQQRDRVIDEAASKPSAIDTAVDGTRGAALATVRPNGTIFFRFHYLDAVVDDAITMLIRAAPAGTDHHNNLPHYRNAFALFVNGSEVEIRAKIPSGAEVVITNLLPYARKIERGSSLMAPDGVFQGVASVLRRKWSGAAAIQYGFRRFPGAGPRGPRASQGGTATRRGDDGFPSITIRARGL